jgi:hypothetical protein
VRQSIQFAASRKPASWFWSNGSAWGTVRQKPSRKAVEVELTVLHGTLPLRTLVVAGVGQVELSRPRILATGKPLKVTVTRSL